MPFANFHPLFLVVILIIVLIVFGPGKLPELGAGLGRGIREFRKHSDALKDEVSSAVKEHEAQAPATTTTATATAAPEVKPAPTAEPPAPQAEIKK